MSIHQRYTVHMSVSGFPLKLFDSFLLQRFPQTMCSLLACCLWEGFCLWQSVWSSTTCLLTSSEYTQVQTVHGKLTFVTSYNTTEPEEKIMSLEVGGGPGGGLQPLIVPLPLSLITTSSFFLGTRPFLSISWEERSSSRGNECFGYLVTQKQWEKCKQSADRSLDPSFHTWSLWLLWRDKLCNIVCFSPDSFITTLQAGS